MAPSHVFLVLPVVAVLVVLALRACDVFQAAAAGVLRHDVAVTGRPVGRHGRGGQAYLRTTARLWRRAVACWRAIGYEIGRPR